MSSKLFVPLKSLRRDYIEISEAAIQPPIIFSIIYPSKKKLNVNVYTKNIYRSQFQIETDLRIPLVDRSRLSIKNNTTHHTEYF